MYAVRPEFGPTLPELLSGHSKAWRFALIGGYVVILVVVLYLLFRGDPDSTRIVKKGEVSFSLSYDAALAERPVVADEQLRLEGTRGRLVTVRPLKLPAYEGRPDGFLPLYAQSLIEPMRQRFKDFEVRREGRAGVNRIPGYEIIFQYRREGATAYGRRSLLLDSYDGEAREGIDVLLLEDRSKVVSKAGDIGSAGSFKTLLRSLRLGE